MRSRSNLPIFLAYALLSLLVLGYLAAQMGGEFALGGYRVTAAFHTGAELVPGDDVTMSGLRVGKVESLNPGSTSTSVTLLLHRQFTPLFSDARAVIRQKNLLGETYVELNRGSERSEGDYRRRHIPQDQTLTPVEIDQVLNALDPQVRDRLTW